MSDEEDVFSEEDANAEDESALDLGQILSRNVPRKATRRSLEVYWEKKALRAQLSDSFGDSAADLEELGW